ncbi:tryptophan synthase subunit alpha [Candidatus Venteria ishoeyi]|uniref:tryptophan synthase subunit alpha n=1 Tax=Candidatus Venteria ishoeyi TaxID=1899563 RepID=UPI0025A6398D|nr:tryptophan synthase subunit alpha [Candidatus Venteria ishoeyi]MDM8547533.1 tryptophan synthase subunit alpha [Candidatus Venteria ishoeyi]
MSRIQSRFAQLKNNQKTALIPFVTAGDPNPGITVELMHNLVKAGANLLELGVPFSDPMADGPVIQLASERALENGVSLSDVLNMVTEFRQNDPDTPVILMGYLNPVEVMGYDNFAKRAAQAGVDGVLTVDLPPEESDDLIKALHPQHIDPIFLLAPTSDIRRIERISSHASGFVYYVSVKGVTGSKAVDVDAVANKLAEIREHIQLPLGVGFGIRDPETAAQVASVADAVIVGSALVQKIETLSPEAVLVELPALVGKMRAAMDAV